MKRLRVLEGWSRSNKTFLAKIIAQKDGQEEARWAYIPSILASPGSSSNPVYL